MFHRARRILIATIAATLVSTGAHATCMNKFVVRAEGNKRMLTLLTGMLTFAEASELAKAVSEKRAPQIEWVDEKGKPIATAVEFSAVRPMPVACGEKASGTVINATFMSFATPTKKMTVKLKPDLIVEFEEQTK
jgi:hypothetical protein